MPSKASLRDEVRRNVKSLRLQCGMSQEQLAKAARLTPHYVSRVERESVNLTLDTLQALAGALGVSSAQLIGDADATWLKPTRKTTEAIEQVIQFLRACVERE